MRLERARAAVVGVGLILAVAYELAINLAGPIALAFMIGQWTT